MSEPYPGPYIIGQPRPITEPFWSLINARGNVVAMRITTAENADLLAASWDMREALGHVRDAFYDDMCTQCGKVIEAIADHGPRCLCAVVERALAKAEGQRLDE